MNRKDHLRIYTAMSCCLLLSRGEHLNPEEIKRLSGMLEDLCFEDENLPESVETGALDEAIDRHISQLREDEVTVLPTDRETLVKFHDNLQMRRTRRSLAAFYEMADERMLANAVLKCLDDEILTLESR